MLDYLKPVGKVLRIPSLPITWPIKKSAELTHLGLSKVVDGLEWSSHVARETAKGVFKAGVAPWLMLAKSRLVTVKRFLWDVPLASVSAAIRTPIALAKSPLEMVRGVRDGIKSIPGNVKELFSSLAHLRIGDMLRSTRKAITDVILPPIKRPMKPIIEPSLNLAGTAAGAELQTFTVGKQIVTETIPEGVSRAWPANSMRTSSAIMADVKAERALKKAVLAKEKAEKQEALQNMVNENKGEPQIGEASKKGAGGGMRATG